VQLGGSEARLMLDSSLGAFAPTGHAPLAPSSARRWTNCPGSHVAERSAPAVAPGVAAEQGTAVHALFACALASGIPPAQLTADPFILVPLVEALLLTRRIIAGRPALLETQLSPLAGLPAVWGTCDVAVFDQHYRLVAIVDLKFGTYAVPADSLQLAVYAVLAGALFGTAPEGVTTWIVQPRASHPHGPARGAHYSQSALLTVEQYIRAAAARTAAPDAPRKAGEWCTFCRAAADCEVRRQAVAARPKSLFFAPPGKAAGSGNGEIT
jgi:hypothetical protein